MATTSLGLLNDLQKAGMQNTKDYKEVFSRYVDQALSPSNFSNVSYGGGGSGINASAPGTKTPGAGSPAVDEVVPETPKPLTEGQSFFEKQPNWSYYQPMGQDAMQGRAQEFADMYAQPQYQEMERKLQQAITDAQAQEQRIRGAFAGTEDMYARREQEQARLDMERAISRGAGRSGVVGHLANQRQQHFSELLAAEEAKKNAELYAVANQLGLVQRQVPDQRMEVAEQVGRLSNQELQRLQDLDYSRGREYDLDQWQRALGVFDRTMLTPVEQLAIYTQLAQVMGETGQMPSVYGSFG